MLTYNVMGILVILYKTETCLFNSGSGEKTCFAAGEAVLLKYPGLFGLKETERGRFGKRVLLNLSVHIMLIPSVAGAWLCCTWEILFGYYAVAPNLTCM